MKESTALSLKVPVCAEMTKGCILAKHATKLYDTRRGERVGIFKKKILYNAVSHARNRSSKSNNPTTDMKTAEKNVSRRSFLKSSLAFAALASVGTARVHASEAATEAKNKRDGRSGTF